MEAAAAVRAAAVGMAVVGAAVVGAEVMRGGGGDGDLRVRWAGTSAPSAVGTASAASNRAGWRLCRVASPVGAAAAAAAVSAGAHCSCGAARGIGGSALGGEPPREKAPESPIESERRPGRAHTAPIRRAAQCPTSL